MATVGRNEPCPCGSGEKYKKCCLPGSQQEAARRRDEKAAVSLALAWLNEHHGEAVADAVWGDFYADLEEEEIEALEQDLEPGLRHMLEVNIGEWLLADAAFDVDGEAKRAGDLLFAQGGPLLPAAGRAWIEALGRTPMGLYEVREVRPGEGVGVRDLLRTEEKTFWVHERSASLSLVVWDVVGARLIGQEGQRVFSGCLYPLGRDVALDCRDEIASELEGEDWDVPAAWEIISAAISGFWLEGLLERPLVPDLVDAGTGLPLLFVTERYRVLDRTALEEVLEAQPDVDGDREDGWVRLEEPEGEMPRVRAALCVTEDGELEVFCRTEQLAEDARRWLDASAGGILQHLGREVTDPRSVKAREGIAPPPRPEIVREESGPIVAEVLRRHYEAWPDEPLPALGGRSAAQAVRTADGRAAVLELLKKMEQREARRFRRTEGGHPAFDFGFLWERLGLEKER